MENIWFSNFEKPGLYWVVISFLFGHSYKLMLRKKKRDKFLGPKTLNTRKLFKVNGVL